MLLSSFFFFNDTAPTEIYTFPYTTLFRSSWSCFCGGPGTRRSSAPHFARSEEHTSELQSRRDLVCRLLLEKKNYLKEDTKAVPATARSWSAPTLLWISSSDPALLLLCWLA